MQGQLFAKEVDYKQWLPAVERMGDLPVETNAWDIPHTIGQLSYLTHSHYRYYGKFPSAVAGQILEEFGPCHPGHYVLDNFCGSGTTLVEAKLRGVPSYGIDISWISALVSNVKTRHVNLESIKKSVGRLSTTHFSSLALLPLELTFANRWFSEEAILDLRRLQTWLFNMAAAAERDFLLVGFLAIVRRVSRAHDAEVRPHIKLDKKERPVIPTFKKKIQDMIEAHALFQDQTAKDTESFCYVGNNLSIPERFHDQKCALVVSHPPYLNSFNYRPVFSLEFFWGAPFQANFLPSRATDLIWDELLAHPANETITSAYFSHLERCYARTFEIQPAKAKLAIVIGDCTRSGKLIPVVDTTIARVTSLGYRLIQKNYRSTHYGLGKYAYAHRADYHGENAEKKDAILVFEKGA